MQSTHVNYFFPINTVIIQLRISCLVIRARAFIDSRAMKGVCEPLCFDTSRPNRREVWALSTTWLHFCHPLSLMLR